MHKILLFGLGRTHLPFLQYLLSNGDEVYVTGDNEEIQNQIEGGEYVSPSRAREMQFDQIYVTPGVPASHWIHEFNPRNEIEYSVKLFPQTRFLGVTGTNGKSTTCTFLKELLEKNSCKVGLAGNIGQPLCTLLGKDLDYIVLELSSFQLHSLKEPFLDGAILTSLEQDHLDWHGSQQAYASSKLNIENLVRDGGVILAPSHLKGQFKKSVIDFGGPDSMLKFDPLQAAVYLRDEKLANIPEALKDFETVSMLSVALLGELGVSSELEKMESFHGLPHRLEKVQTDSGFAVYNDSKATTPDAAVYALNQLQYQSITLIVGGQSKGLDYQIFLDELKEYENRIKRLYLYGDLAKMDLDLGNWKIDVHKVVSWTELERELGASQGDLGDCLLLSPGLSSFDQFESYEKRGEAFRCLVKSLSL